MDLVFGLVLRQTEGLIGSIIGLLGLDLAVPDHSTLSRRGQR
jgi:Transposase DDE domain